MQLDNNCIETILKISRGDLKHIYQGDCPDDIEGFSSRDINCKVCLFLIEIETYKNKTQVNIHKKGGISPKHIKVLYHVTTQRKAAKYKQSGRIISPVRGFNTLKAAMYWAMKVGRKVIYEVEAPNTHKLPDHRNPFGNAYWNDGDIKIDAIKCVVSAT